jgi:hypothetical protein
MKKKINEHKKSKNPTNMKKTTNTNSKNNNSCSETSKNSTSENIQDLKKNSYPSDILGLFQRLGIE